MTDKTEAQPEALRLAEFYSMFNDGMSTAAASELRRQHAEIERLRALAATCYAGLGGECDLPVIWLDALSDAANGEPFDTDGLLPYTSAIRAQLVAQTNRAASAEQQVTALTHRLDMANRLNTGARNQLAQLSARQAAPDGWRLVPAEPTEEMVTAGQESFGVHDCYYAMLSAAPPPTEREPKCWCETCRPNTLSDMRFIVCPDCGNKRCPKATHHDNACTNSNAPGQPGSSWEHVKPHGATND